MKTLCCLIRYLPSLLSFADAIARTGDVVLILAQRTPTASLYNCTVCSMFGTDILFRVHSHSNSICI